MGVVRLVDSSSLDGLYDLEISLLYFIKFEPILFLRNYGNYKLNINMTKNEQKSIELQKPSDKGIEQLQKGFVFKTTVSKR